jgi:hypothetical protein
MKNYCSSAHKKRPSCAAFRWSGISLSRAGWFRNLAVWQNALHLAKRNLARGSCTTLLRPVDWEPRAEDRGHWITHPRFAYSVAATHLGLDDFAQAAVRRLSHACLAKPFEVGYNKNLKPIIVEHNENQPQTMALRLRLARSEVRGPNAQGHAMFNSLRLAFISFILSLGRMRMALPLIFSRPCLKEGDFNLNSDRLGNLLKCLLVASEPM